MNATPGVELLAESSWRAPPGTAVVYQAPRGLALAGFHPHAYGSSGRRAPLALGMRVWIVKLNWPNNSGHLLRAI
jgi:hypothetical protein